MPFIAGAALLVLLLVVGRSFVGARPRSLAKGFRFSAGVLLGLVTIALIVTGRVGFAFLTSAGAWYFLFGTTPPWVGFPPGGTGSRPGEGSNGQARGQTMSRLEALKVLGLKEGASVQDIRAAHRRLILQTHPDKGGTSYLAAKINEAKDVLLKR